MFIIQRDGFTVHGLEFETQAEAQAYYNANAKVLQATASYQVNIDEIELVDDPEDGFPYDVAVLPNDADLDFQDDGQPTEYEEYQDFYGGDDWDHGQYDEY